MNSKQITFMIIFLFASMQMIKGQLLGRLFKIVNFPEYGKLRNSALTTSSAMESLFTDYKSYFDHLHSGLSNSGLLEHIGGCNLGSSPQIMENLMEPVFQSPNLIKSMVPMQSVSEMEVIPKLVGA